MSSKTSRGIQKPPYVTDKEVKSKPRLHSIGMEKTGGVSHFCVAYSFAQVAAESW